MAQQTRQVVQPPRAFLAPQSGVGAVMGYMQAPTVVAGPRLGSAAAAAAPISATGAVAASGGGVLDQLRRQTGMRVCCCLCGCRGLYHAHAWLQETLANPYMSPCSRVSQLPQSHA